MATTVSELINHTRRYIRDWPDIDVTTASLASNTTTLTIADGTIYTKNFHLEIDQEIITVAANGSGTTATIRRGVRGSTAVTHASGATVLINPRFNAIEIIDALNDALDACFPTLYKPVSEEFTGILTGTYEYNIPNITALGVPIPYLSRLEMKEPGDLYFWEFRNYEIRRGATPFIKLNFDPTSGSVMRVNGFGPFAHFTAITDTTDAYLPVNTESLLPLYAAAQLMGSGEAGRVRADTGIQDQREQANRVGSSMQASVALENRFYRRLQSAAMSPMARHMIPTF